jgi:hypothetical protein
MSDSETVRLKDYLECIIEERTTLFMGAAQGLKDQLDAETRFTAARFLDIDRSTALMATILDKRLEGMNEVRSQLREQAGMFLTIAAHEAYQKSVEADLRILRDLNTRMNTLATESSISWTRWLAVGGLLVGFLAMAIALIKHAT